MGTGMTITHALTDRQVLVGIVVLALVHALAKPLAVRSLRRAVEAHGLNARPPLPDAGHALLPDLSKQYWVGDAMAAGIVFGGGGYLLASGRGLLLARVALLVLLVNALKMVVTHLTVLPDASGVCEARERGNLRLLVGSCNDLFPSGHMALAFAALVVCRGRVPDGVWTAGVAYAAVMAFVTVASRNHYTIDVLGSLLFVTALAPLAA